MAAAFVLRKNEGSANQQVTDEKSSGQSKTYRFGIP